MGGLASALRSLLRSRRGSAATEFALTAPVVVLFLFGTIEVGRALWLYSTLQYAAEEAVRHASVTEGISDADIVAFAKSRSAGIAPSAINVTIARDASVHDFILVQVSATFTPVFNQFPATISLQGSSRGPILH